MPSPCFLSDIDPLQLVSTLFGKSKQPVFLIREKQLRLTVFIIKIKQITANRPGNKNRLTGILAISI